ncbi:MAG: insulinase family protein, partial [Oligoflexia bacterium]|nr:insulinase family protein [Oligoflexia bacterium]
MQAILLFICTSMVVAANPKEDPFEKITIGKLPNEMEYFSAHSDKAKLAVIEFHVKAGQDLERPEEYGVVHLAEHILFRDGKLKDNKSFLQVFEDKGGEVYASVSSRKTKYSVKISSQYSLWALKLLTKMLQNRTFTFSEFKKAKQSVMIEIGEPSPLDSGFKFLSGKKLFSFLNGSPSFFKSEFGVDFSKYKQPWNADRINNAYLSLEQVQAFYESFYTPKNIQVFIAGNFDQNQTISFIKNRWSHYKKDHDG